MTCQSNGMTATITPVIPPSRKISRKPRQNSIGVVSTTLPFHMVAIHAKNWTPLGITMIRLAAEKKAIASAGIPVANMWWTHTPKEMKAIATSEVATQMYPLKGRREKTLIIVETMPVAGTNRM